MASSDRRSQRLPIFFWIALALFAAVPIARWSVFETDHQLANLFGMGIAFLGCIVAYVGMGVRFARTVFRKFLFLGIPFLIAAIGWSLFEFRGFTGETLPVFRLKARPNVRQATEAGVPREAITAREKAVLPFESTQFLGSDRNGVIQNNEFSIAWNDHLPSIVWKIPIGAGWSSFAVSNGLAITLEQLDDQECLTAFELTTGKVVWRHKSQGKHTQAFGGVGPRSTPTIRGGHVYAQTALGIVFCVELQTGKLVWQQDLLKLAGVDQVTSEKSILWGRSGSPLVFDNQLVVPFGGRSGDPAIKSLIAFDLNTGKELWSGGDQQIAYSSPVLLTLFGVRQIVSINEDSATGHNPTNGQTLWSTPWPSKSNADACSSQPVALDDHRLLLGKGYSQGSKLVELNYSGTQEEQGYDPASWKVNTLWTSNRALKTKFTSAIAFQGLLYGLSDGVLECIDPKDGSRVWKGKRYGHGQSIIINGHILVTSEDGRVILIPATDSGQGREIAEIQVLEGITWNVPIVAGPYLLVRNAEFVACLISDKEAGHDAGTVSQ